LHAARYEALAKTGTGTIQNAQQFTSQLHQQEASVQTAFENHNLAQRQVEALKAQPVSAEASLVTNLLHICSPQLGGHVGCVSDGDGPVGERNPANDGAVISWDKFLRNGLRGRRRIGVVGVTQPQPAAFRHGNAVGLFREIDSNAKNPLLRTTAENESIQKVS
jgi:hypothetical protein